MASSDEDDLDALRNAALASMKIKQAAQEPQGIQVLSSIQSQPKPYEETQVKPEDQFVSEFGDDVPFAFKQAVLQQQSQVRGNWRGRFRGNFHQRGFPRQRGRGRGFFTIPPPNQSALIVIQVEQPEQKDDKPKDSKQRPLLLRPQDKWASGDSSSQSSPQRPKDTSKFRRYDDDTDSDDEDDPNADPAEFYGEQDISGELEDQEMEAEPQGPDGDHHDIKDLKKDKLEAAHIPEAVDSISEINTDSVVQKSHELDQPDVKSLTDISVLNISNNCKVTMEHSGNVDVSSDYGKDYHIGKDSHEKEACLKESNNITFQPVATKQQNVISLNDVASNEGTPLRDEVRPEESVSNSYSSFSRFNRRNRRNTGSGEDSDVDSDNEESNMSNWSNGAAKFQIESSSESEDNDIEDAASKVVPDLSDESDNDIPVAKHTVPTSADQVASSSSGSPSQSGKSSPSSSASSSPSPSRESSPSPIKSERKSDSLNTTQRHKSEKISEDVKRHSHVTGQAKGTESKYARDISRKGRHSPLSPRRGNSIEHNKIKVGRAGRSPDRVQENLHHTKRDISPVRKREMRRDVSPDKKVGSQKRNVSSPHRSDGQKRRKTVSPDRKTSKYSQKESPVKADPEFDATNYRDKNTYKDRRGPSSYDVDKWNHKEYSGKAPQVKDDRIKAGERNDSNIRDKEVRHFKEISRMKDERRNEVRDRPKVLEETNITRDELKEDREEISYFKKKLQTKSGAIRQSKQTDLKTSVRSNDKGKTGSAAIREKPRIKSDTAEKTTKNVVKKEKQPLPKSYALDEERMKRRRSHSRSPAAYRDSRKEPLKSSKHSNHSGEKKKRINSPENSRNRDSQGVRKYVDQKSTHKFDERSKKYREERLKRRSVDVKSEQKEKRRSIEERLKKIANIASDSGSDSESGKSISSLSDVSSDSESEAWRNKKSGASRNTVDIENERKRRRLQEQQNKKASGKESVKDRGDRELMNENRSDWHHTGGDRSYRDRHSQYGKNNSRRDDHRSANLDHRSSSRDHRGDSMGKERYYQRKNLTFYEEEPAFKRKPIFQEEDSDNDTSTSKVHRGVISVINKDSNKSKDNKRNSIPSLLDIKVSRTTEDKTSRKDLAKLAKKERLVIQVQKSSDEEEEEDVHVKSKRKKHSKRGKHVTEDASDSEVERDIRRPEQVVSVSFGEVPPPSKSSIYDRLGVPVSKVKGEDKSRSRLPDGKRSHDIRKLPEVSLSAKGKKIRLTDSGKYKTKAVKEDTEDDALNRRIQQIQEKNAEILRRKKEIEQDKQKYG